MTTGKVHRGAEHAHPPLLRAQKKTMIGIELVTDRETKERAYHQAEQIMYAALEKGLSFKLTMGNIITLCPPLTVTEDELMRAFDIVEECIEMVSMKS